MWTILIESDSIRLRKTLNHNPLQWIPFGTSILDQSCRLSTELKVKLEELLLISNSMIEKCQNLRRFVLLKNQIVHILENLEQDKPYVWVLCDPREFRL